MAAYIGHRSLYKQMGWGWGAWNQANEEINGGGGGGGGGAFAHTENYQFWYNCSVIHSYTYYQEIAFFCLWHEKLTLTHSDIDFDFLLQVLFLRI